MSKYFVPAVQAVLSMILTGVVCVPLSFSQTGHKSKVFGGYFARTWRSLFPVKARDRQIERSPEKMYGTDLAVEAGGESLEEGVGQNEGAPKACDGIFIVAGMNGIAIEANGIGHLDRHRINLGFHAQRRQGAKIFAEEISDRNLLQTERPRFADALSKDGFVGDEIEFDIEQVPAADRHGGGRKPRAVRYSGTFHQWF